MSPIDKKFKKERRLGDPNPSRVSVKDTLRNELGISGVPMKLLSGAIISYAHYANRSNEDIARLMISEIKDRTVEEDLSVSEAALKAARWLKDEVKRVKKPKPKSGK